MTRSRLIGLAGAAVAGAVLAVVLIGVALLLAGGALGSTTAATSAGWMVPVAAGLTVAWTVWKLVPPVDSPVQASTELREVVCESCGGAVFTDWRLCPHCGALIDSCTIETT